MLIGQSVTCVVEFVGGPLDGFSVDGGEMVDDLPTCVAIPIDMKAARLFGLNGIHTTSNYSAIYRLEPRETSLQYRFHSTRRNMAVSQ